MRSERSLSTITLGMTALLTTTACPTDLTVTGPVDLTQVVEAQFDPTNPIPVLTLVPSPTGLAQNPDGPGLSVTAAPCELPTTKQCLQFVTGWPTTTPITLFFSGLLDETTIKSGIKLFEVAGSPIRVPSPVDYTFVVQDPRPAPNPGCMMGGNGSDPERTYGDGQIAPGIALVLTPARPLKPGTDYILLVEASAEGGLRAANGSVVEPSSLFSLMNLPPEEAPVTMDGTVTNALLRSNLQSLIIPAVIERRDENNNAPIYSDLSDAERAMVDGAVQARAGALFGLYSFFDQVIRPIDAAGLTSRDKLVFANAWQTGDVPVEIMFDPAKEILPFPNVELLTVPTGPGLSQVRVNLSRKPACQIDPMTMMEIPARDCDTTTSSITKGQLNTMTGFSNTAPIDIPVNGDVDPASLAGNVVMYPINDQGAVSGTAVELDFRVTNASSTAPGLIQIVPRQPLDQNALYVVGLERGILDTSGKAVAANSTYSLLKTPVELINSMNEVLPAVRPVLECSTASTLGRVASDAEVAGIAAQLENLLVRPRWQVALQALEGLSTPIPRTDVLMAFTYKTADVTSTLDAIRGPDMMAGALDGWDQVAAAAMLPRLSPAFRTVTGTAAIYGFLGLVDNFCVSACEAGATQGIPANMCRQGDGSANPALEGHPTCQLVLNLYAGNLRQIEGRLLTTYKITSGSPYTAGGFDPRKFAFGMPAFTPPTFDMVPVWFVTGAGTSSVAPAPATIVQHGFGSNKEAGFLMANALAAAGHATVLMDLPFHGSRASDLINNMTSAPCVTQAPETVMCDAQAGTCTGGCDDVQDPSGTGMLSANLFATRDNFRQAVIDHLVLMRALRVESMAGGVLPYVDGTNITYVGQSLGGITGGNFAAFAPELSAIVLNVPGGGLVDILLGTVPQINAPLYAALSSTGNCKLVNPANPASGCQDEPVFRTFKTIAQWVLDPGDPASNSIGVDETHGGISPLTSDKVLIQMATPDPVVPNSTTRALGRAYGFNPDSNAMDSHFQTWDFSAYGDTNCHAWLFAPICGDGAFPGGVPVLGSICATFGAQEQAATFLATGGMTVTARKSSIQLPLPPPLPNACPTF